MEQIQAAASELFVNVAVALLALLAAYATYGIRVLTNKAKVQAQQIKDKEARTLFLNALDDVAELTNKTVTAIEQTAAREIREAVKNGTRDPEELKALAVQAANEIKGALKPDTIRIIGENLGDFDAYLAKCIETKVLELKSGVLELSAVA